ncbi:uncharacterized protein LOC112086788 [Eutrema salsugineum]|uniref:uncharacterized protein LOC112086788 n=1 Tax=Eutrema salsugineum TaxID=72664 RepID=UPI000CED0891|nr:uncharacterized protein LOC112086788 [Eutrema salsugineum]
MVIDSVLEFVNKTASNSSFMFLFCNFIIILILLGNSKPGSQDKPNTGSLKPMLTSDSVLISKSGFEKSMLISETVLSSKPGFEKSVLITEPSLTSKPCLQEPVLISKSFIPSKPPGSERSLTSKLGLQIMSSRLKSGSDFSEKDEKGRMKKTESLEVENESEVECVLRRRVEEFIRKVNTQWKSENTKSNYLLH